MKTSIIYPKFKKLFYVTQCQRDRLEYSLFSFYRKVDHTILDEKYNLILRTECSTHFKTHIAQKLLT